MFQKWLTPIGTPLASGAIDSQRFARSHTIPVVSLSDWFWDAGFDPNLGPNNLLANEGEMLPRTMKTLFIPRLIPYGLP
jgi:hypothetical protein